MSEQFPEPTITPPESTVTPSDHRATPSEPTFMPSEPTFMLPESAGAFPESPFMPPELVEGASIPRQARDTASSATINRGSADIQVPTANAGDEPYHDPEIAHHDDGGLDLATQIAHAARGQKPRIKKPKKKFRPAQYSSAKADGRDPQLLGNAFDRFTRASGWTAELNVYQVLGRWPAIVGMEIADHSHPEAYQESVLTVRADSTSWATQLRLLAPTLVARLNEELGQGTVTKIVVKGPDAPSWKHGMKAVRDGRGPRDTYG